MVSLLTDPRAVREEDFPRMSTPAEQWCFLLNYALLAPSEYNIQPWLFKVRGKRVELYADLSRRLPIVDPDNRELVISCGAAFLNLRLALRHFGYREEVECFPSDDLTQPLATIISGHREEATTEDEQLFAAIARRHSNRHTFADRMVPDSLLMACTRLAGYEGTWFHMFQDSQQRLEVVKLIVTGDKQQWADRRFREELASWVHRSNSGRRDGVPGYANFKGSIAGSNNPFVVRTVDLWRGEAIRDKHLMGAPAVALLGTFADSVGDWFSAGQALERVWLKACAEGVQASVMNQPIEIPALRKQLSQIIGRAYYPQLIVRLGYAPDVIPTPRRNVQDVLLEVQDH